MALPFYLKVLASWGLVADSRLTGYSFFFYIQSNPRVSSLGNGEDACIVRTINDEPYIIFLFIVYCPLFIVRNGLRKFTPLHLPLN
jgi:hypothetical protein